MIIKQRTFFTIPNHYNIKLIENNNSTYIYIYSNIYYMYYAFKKKQFLFNKEGSFFVISSLDKINPTKHDFLVKELHHFFYTLSNLFFIKIKFKGKGYKIKKNKKKMWFFFGRSHRSNFYAKKVLLKKLGKYKFILLSSDWKKLKWAAKLIRSIRSLNIFTKRGLRMSRQIVFKKTGKKSSFM